SRTLAVRRRPRRWIRDEPLAVQSRTQVPVLMLQDVCRAPGRFGVPTILPFKAVAAAGATAVHATAGAGFGVLPLCRMAMAKLTYCFSSAWHAGSSALTR